MSTTVVLVVDGFGVGAMPDAGALRPTDAASDTCGHVLDGAPAVLGRPVRLPVLSALGLGLVHPHPALARPDQVGPDQVAADGPSPWQGPGASGSCEVTPRTTATGSTATWETGMALPGTAVGTAAFPGRAVGTVAAGRAALGYPGADTFAGHQTLMGADFSTVTVARLADHADGVAATLEAAGHAVRPLDGGPLVVDDRVLVHDNLEADPGVNWNVSCRLADLPFRDVLAVARTVRAVAPVARVIAVGGHADRPLTAFVRAGDGGTVGLDTPASGFYRNGGLEVQHLGAPIDHARQLPHLAVLAGARVVLVGKAADILVCEAAVRRPAVDTEEVLAHTLEAVRAARREPGARTLVVANVQETDLAGHQQDTGRYAAVLERVDAGLGRLLPLLDRPGDQLIVTADHGNDPTVGHAYHTREYVPVLSYRLPPDAPADGGPMAGGTTGGDPTGGPGPRARPESYGRAEAGYDRPAADTGTWPSVLWSHPPQRLPDAGSLADVGATAALALGLDPARLENGTPLRSPDPAPRAEAQSAARRGSFGRCVGGGGPEEG